MKLLRFILLAPARLQSLCRDCCGLHGHLVAWNLQEKFDERWQVLLIPKLAEEEVHMRNDAVTVRKQRLDNAQVCCSNVLPLNC